MLENQDKKNKEGGALVQGRRCSVIHTYMFLVCIGHDFTETDADALSTVRVLRVKPVFKDGNNLGQNPFSHFTDHIAQSSGRHLSDQTQNIIKKLTQRMAKSSECTRFYKIKVTEEKKIGI